MLVASLLIASFVIFGALYLAPGNPITALSGGRALPPASLHVLELRYHLNQPFLAQYWYWLDNALHGNLGISITLQQNVSAVIAARMWTTGGLVLYAALIILVVGIGSGVIARAAARLGRYERAGLDRDHGGRPVVRGRDRADPAVLGEARLVSRAGQRDGPVVQRAALHPARHRAGRLLARHRGPGDQGRGARGSRPRARADGDQPGHPAAPADSPPRAAQRGHPDRHGVRHHDRRR